MTEEQTQAQARTRARSERAEDATPAWQAHLAASAAFKHWTEDQDPPLEVRFYDTRLEVPESSPKQSRSLLAVIMAVLNAHGYPLHRQVATNQRGLTVHLDV